MNRLNDNPYECRNWTSSAIPFPESLCTAPIESISYHKLVDRNEYEVSKLVEACKKMGIFRLDLSEDNEEMFQTVAGTFKLCNEVFSLPTKVNLTNNMENNRPHLAGYYIFFLFCF